jgi:hypothetical protein
MPPKPETDPIVLEARKQRNRENSRLRSQRHRAKSKQLATTLLGHAFERVAGPSNTGTSIEENQFLAQRTAQAILKGTLRRHGVTIERLVRAAAEALEAMKLTRAGETASRPDFGNRLRAVDTFLRLLQAVGDVPDPKSKPIQPVKVNIFMAYEQDEPPRAITLETEPERAE